MFPHQVSCVPLYPKDGKVTNRAQEEYDAEGNLVPAALACMLHAERISYETAAASSYFFLFPPPSLPSRLVAPGLVFALSATFLLRRHQRSSQAIFTLLLLL